MAQIFRAVTPYVLMGLLMLVLVMLVPGIATWLPGTLLD
jgi:TRAP-type mannitol/chloroaromatic compound transport system permease large subunit